MGKPRQRKTISQKYQRLLADAATIIAAYQMGATPPELAEQYGTSPTLIIRLLNEKQVSLRPGVLRPKKLDKNAQQVLADYQAGVPPAELARRYQVSLQTIKRFIDSHQASSPRRNK
jgi:uncharacterized protein (DUF433 family)